MIFLIVVVLGALSIIVASFTREAAETQRNQRTQEALAQAREALLGYAMIYRDAKDPNSLPGFLPCPDTAAKGGAVYQPGDGTAAGSGHCGGTADYAIGLLPHRTLGLPDLRDADGNCLWYAVSNTFKNVSNLPPLSLDTQAQLTVTNNSGATLAAPEDANGGAAAVIIAPGAPLAGQSRSTIAQTCGANPAEIAAYIENVATVFTNGTVKDGSGGIVKNDVVAWITPRDIFGQIKKNTNFTTQLNTLSSQLTSALTPTTPGAPLPAHDAGDASAVGNKLVGKFPAATAVADASYSLYRDNWRDLFRYVVCAPSSTCLTANGASCMGTLLFAGERAASGPRTVTEKSSASSLFDAANATSYTTAGSNAFTGTSAFDASSPAQDMAFCLNSPALPPQPPLSTADIVGSGQQAESGDMIGVDTAAGTIRLGSAGGATGSGCFWYATPVPFGDGLRIYFNFIVEVDNGGSGFTLALADSARNPSTAMCGYAGQDLGYGGTTGGSLAPIKPPKIGVEFDFYYSSQRADPYPFPWLPDSEQKHIGIDYWGISKNWDGSLKLDDDVEHDAGAGTTQEPFNSSGVAFAMNVGTRYHVRVDITREDLVGTQHRYVTQVYATSSFGSCSEANFRNVTEDLSSLCPAQSPTISRTRTIDDFLDGATDETLRYVLVGFTEGQVGADQRIRIYSMAIQGR